MNWKLTFGSSRTTPEMFRERTLIARTSAVVTCLGCMASSSQIELTSTAAVEPTLAKTLAPEEIRPGDFVTPLFVVAELPSFWWRMDAWDCPPEEPVRMRFMPSTQGSPLKVCSVCLPFVLVKSPNGEHSSLDLRSCQLARLDKSHARRVWKAFKKTSRKNDRTTSPSLV